MALWLAWLICTWTVLGTLPSLPFFYFLFLYFYYIINIYYLFHYFLFTIIFLLFYLEWTQNVCWPRLTYKRVEPVVSISWASCYPRYVVSAVFVTATGLAGWLDVTRRYSIKTAKPILKLFRPSGSHIILVSSDPYADTQFQGEPLQRGLYIHGGGKIGDFRRKSPFISGNGAR